MTIRLWRVALTAAFAFGVLAVAVQVSAVGPVTRVDKPSSGECQQVAAGSRYDAGDGSGGAQRPPEIRSPRCRRRRAADSRAIEKDGIKRVSSKNEQNAVSSQIVAAGGKIVGTFQSAVNGIKVQIPSNKIGALRQIVGVVDIKGVKTYQRHNLVGVPRVQAPAVWAGVPHFRGEGMKVAIIDTGIDYTHANFGGPGTVAAFDAASATSTLPANPALFGPTAPKVKGGVDLVGDDYNADDPTSIPQPDPNPLDCNGHGSHVAGTAAGFGVKSDGTTYAGPYDAHHIQQFLPDRPRRCAQGRPLCGARLRLLRFDQCRRRGARLGGRPRHGRRQHVARLRLRHVGQRRCVSERQRGEGRHRGRRLVRQFEATSATSLLRRPRAAVPFRWRQPKPSPLSRQRTWPSSCWRRSGKDHCGNQRQRGSVRKPFQRNGEGRAGRSAARRRQPRLQRRRIQCERAGSRQDCRGAARHLRPCSPRRFSVSKRAQSRSS